MNRTSKESTLARHGESVTNEKRVYQGDDDALTDAGVEQAERLGQFLEPYHFDAIISSGLERALQTVHIIEKYVQAPHSVPLVGKNYIFDVPGDDHEQIRSLPSLLREIDNPSEIVGLKWDDPRAIKIKKEMDRIHSLDLGSTTFRQHYSDEENMYDLWRRAQTVVDYLERRPEKSILVVAHGGIIKLSVANMFRRHKDQRTSLMSTMKRPLEMRAELKQYKDFSRAAALGNAEYVPVRYDVDEGWRLRLGHSLHLEETSLSSNDIPQLPGEEGLPPDRSGDYLS